MLVTSGFYLLNVTTSHLLDRDFVIHPHLTLLLNLIKMHRVSVLILKIKEF